MNNMTEHRDLFDLFIISVKKMKRRNFQMGMLVCLLKVHLWFTTCGGGSAHVYTRMKKKAIASYVHHGGRFDSAI